MSILLLSETQKNQKQATNLVPNGGRLGIDKSALTRMMDNLRGAQGHNR